MDVEIDAIERYMRETNFYLQNLKLRKKAVKVYLDQIPSDAESEEPADELLSEVTSQPRTIEPSSFPSSMPVSEAPTAR